MSENLHEHWVSVRASERPCGEFVLTGRYESA